MKRIVSVFLALLLFVGALAMLAGCGEEKVTVGEGPLGAYSPAITVTYARPYYGTDESNLSKLGWTMTENAWFDLIKQELGIKIRVEWTLNDFALYFDKLSASALEGHIPDLLDISAYESAYLMLKTLHNSDLITELDDVFAQYQSESSKALYALAGEEVLYPATFDGKLYGICQVAAGEASAKTFYYIRKDWLDNLNLAVPNSFDSLSAVIEAFAVKDPDGNGEDDTFGLSVNSVQSTELDAIFNGFGAYPNIWLENSDGTLSYGSVSDAMREPISYLSHLIKSGYVDYAPVSGTNPAVAFVTGRAGIVIGQANSILTVADVMKRNDSAEIVTVSAFNTDGNTAAITAGTNSYRYYTVSRECKYPEVVVKLNNFIIDMAERAESDMELYNNYFTLEDGSIHMYNYAPVVQEDYPSRNYNNAAAITEAIRNNDESLLTNQLQTMLFDWVKKYNDGDTKYRGYALLYGEDGVQSMQGTFFENDLYVHDKFVSAPTDTMETAWDTLNNLEYSYINQILVGEQELSYFDIFKSEWASSGGSAVTEEVNAWYESVNR